MSEPLQLRAGEYLAFGAGSPVAERVAACKSFLRDEMGRLRARHENGASGLEIARGRSQIIDLLLERLFTHSLEAYGSSPAAEVPTVAMVALGGYGRGELSPWSDLDVMFLFPARTKPGVVNPCAEFLTREVLYILWDCGLKVGHSARTMDQVFVEARRNIHTKTALLEARHIAGSRAVFDAFARDYHNFYTGEAVKAYISDRLDDQAHRRAKYGNTVFMQEPDVKNGVGGLRDYQNALWMARVKLGISAMEELGAQRYLKAEEVTDFTRAYDFLLRVRNDMHFLSPRPTEVLSLDLQPRVAWNLGFRQADVLVRIEHFMQAYYRAAQTILRLAQLIESRLALTVGRDARGEKISVLEMLRPNRLRRSQRIDGFILRGQELAAESPGVFQEDPVRLIRVFRHCQQMECSLGFPLAELIRESLPLTANIALSPDAAVSFRAILSQVGSVHPILAQMHELGVLGRFLPEFNALTCLVQHELYHRYTADVHTLATIRELDGIFAGGDPVTDKYRTVLHEIANPSLVYLTLLLHDIGKAEGIQGHSESGVRLAGPVLERLGIGPSDRELVLFIIKNHLLMARFWQKRDVDDPKTALSFAESVGDAERLRYLYVHTFCDARGTSADLWNSYKDMLHTKLYRATAERLQLGSAVDAGNEAKKKMTQQQLIAHHMPGVSDDEVAAHFSMLPDRYFIHTEPAEIALHIQMVNRLLKSIAAAESIGSLRPIIDWQDDVNRSLTVVNIVTWDRAGLFYKLAGAFSVAGLNILGAKVISRSDHIAIDTFYVVEPGRGVVQSATAQDIFARNLEAALVSNKDLYPEILAQAKKIASTRYLSSGNNEALHSALPPIVEVYHELSMQRTIVEIQARDQLGLLYRLAKTISEHGFDITFARIGTERGVAIDTFYIENEMHQAVDDVKPLHALRSALSSVITPPAQAPAA